MSSGLMDTEPGGEERNQYEAADTYIEPHKKSGGQFGEASTATDVDPSTAASEQASRGAKTAENIRYGQSLSEQGMGGQTTTSSGTANQDVGLGSEAMDEGFLGGADDQTGKSDLGTGEGAQDARVESGYGGKEGYDNDMDRTIGA